MSDRTYRTLLGLLILIVLNFEVLHPLMYVLIGLLFIEGLTNLRIPKLICKLRNCVASSERYIYQDADLVAEPRFGFEAERLWRLLVGGFLLIGFALVDALWFFPWFMGFAIFGAGLSGVCPVLLGVRWLGFR